MWCRSLSCFVSLIRNARKTDHQPSTLYSRLNPHLSLTQRVPQILDGAEGYNNKRQWWRCGKVTSYERRTAIQISHQILKGSINKLSLSAILMGGSLNSLLALSVIILVGSGSCKRSDERLTVRAMCGNGGESCLQVYTPSYNAMVFAHIHVAHIEYP